MKRLLFRWPIAAAMTLFQPAQAIAVERPSDTQVDVGGYSLHFHVIPGRGTPILFETGGGDDASAWGGLLPAIAEVTGATLIAYDRPGFGKSGFDPSHPSLADQVDALERGLKALGYDGKLLLVAHSLGGFYATQYAARHADKVQAAVLIDANVACFFTPAYMAARRDANQETMAKTKGSRPGVYYIFEQLPHTIELMERMPFPARVPAIDIVSDKTPFSDTADAQRWKTCHRQFADGAPNRQGLVASGTGHYVYKDNPALVVNAVAKMYANSLDEPGRAAMLERSLAYNVDAADQTFRREAQRRHSENDLNDWGYQLLASGDKRTAVDVFKLNTSLHPKSANTYDSLAEGYETLGDKAQAIANYRLALQLDPGKEHSMTRLRALQP